MSVRIGLWLLRRHPRWFVERHGEEVAAALVGAAQSGASGAWLVADAVWTLIRSWRHEMRRGGGAVRRESRVSQVVREARYAVRTLVRDPLHGAVIVSTLALAIGANAAVFSVAYSVLLRTLPYDSPERTVRVEPPPTYITSSDGYGVSETLTGLPQVETASTFIEGGTGNLEEKRTAEPVRVTHVDDRFFDVLGARLKLGRPPVEGGAGGAEAVLGYGLWRRGFGGDAAVVGRTIRLSGHAVTVTGVAAPEVDYPAGTDLWVSYPAFADVMGAAWGAEAIARITRPELIAEVRDLHESRLRAEWETSRGSAFPDWRRPQLTPLRESLVGSVADSLKLLFGASALVLLLGCVNLAGLTVARNAGRGAEFAMRRALGASRRRLVGMLILESLAIALVAGTIAVAFVVWGRALLTRLLPPGLPGLAGAGPGAETVVFVAGLVVVTALFMGVVPAVQLWSSDTSVPRVAGRFDARRRRLHPSLIVIEVAFTVVLVVSAGLMARSVMSLRSVPLGFDTDGVYTFEARLPWVERGWDTAAFLAFADGVSAALEREPGVTRVAMASRLPLSNGMNAGYRIWPAGEDDLDSRKAVATFRVSSGFFDAMGIRLLAGPGFADGAGSASTIVVSRSVAESLFGRIDVIGEAVRMRTSTRREPPLLVIAGVVEDTRPGGFLGDPTSALYQPFRAGPAASMAFAIRTGRGPRDVTALIERVVRNVDPTIAPFDVRSMRSAADRPIAARTALARVTALFGMAALTLAVLGIWGLVARSVIRRRREIGVRLALGARAADVLGMVLRGVLGLATLGVAAGLLAGFAATRLLAGFLFGVGPTDPATFAAVSALVLVAALAAGLGPAARAARTDPVDSLRSD